MSNTEKVGKIVKVNSSWKEDANAVIKDIKKHVHNITLSKLPSNSTRTFFNITTLEMKDFCVELSAEGFRIVSEKHDSEDKRGKYPVHETPYSMLDSLSPAYRDSFSKQLTMKLNKLQKERGQKDENMKK